MAQYIDKYALLAEIEKLIERAKAERVLYPKTILSAKNYLLIEDYNKLLSFINTLEVKEVDLEKEIQDHIKECLDVKFPTNDVELIKKDVAYTARKFFELGLKAQIGEEV